MFRYLALVVGSISTIIHANPVQLEPRANTIHWAACDVNKTLNTQCGSLTVPLDYTDASNNATINLEIVKVPAKNTPSRGSVFLNFGGPGSSGVADVAAVGGQIQAVLGGYHDLINVVPRGTGNTLLFSCFANATLRSAQGEPLVGRASDVAEGQDWALMKILAETCGIAQNDTGRFVGTASTARDIVSVVDALGEDGLVRYWGWSYGTLLGSTLVSMFPDRIDRAIIDGVVNPNEYYHQVETELYTSTDAVFAGFVSDCIAAPARCALAHNQSITDLKIAIFEFLENLRQQPFIVPPTALSIGYTIDYTTVRSLIQSTLYFPAQWSDFATILNALMTNNVTVIASYVAKLAAAPPSLEAEAQYGIKCSDSFVRLPDLPSIEPTLRARWDLSSIGSDTSDFVSMACAQWPFAAKERYSGDFNVKTRHPVLLVSNEADPVTPLVSARNVSSGFEGSVLLEQTGYGHTTLAQLSVCTAKAIRAYMIDGTMPKQGTVCERGTGPMPPDNGWDETIAQLGA